MVENQGKLEYFLINSFFSTVVDIEYPFEIMFKTVKRIKSHIGINPMIVFTNSKCREIQIMLVMWCYTNEFGESTYSIYNLYIYIKCIAKILIYSVQIILI